tara:strand:- start:165 stop:506 length:342 start_codon:yes stop_codon:yes gene_type:complete
MSFKVLKKLVSKKNLEIVAIWNGDPKHNDIIRLIGKKHKVGFFESVKKLLVRSSLESEESFEELFLDELIIVKNNKTKEIYSLRSWADPNIARAQFKDIGGIITEFYKKISSL